MSYYIWFEKGGTFRLPVNPEKITRSRDLKIEEYEVLNGETISIPGNTKLEDISFEAEFPHAETHYTNPGFKNSDFWVSKLRSWQRNQTPVRFIASNGIGDDINMRVIISKLKSEENAGEEADIFMNITLKEYVEPTVDYVEISIENDEITQESGVAEPSEAISSQNSYTVKSGDSLSKISKLFYGNASKYKQIADANGISNPNLIYPGQVLQIP